MHMATVRRSALCGIAAAMVLVVPAVAFGAHPADVFAGQVAITQKSFPMRFASNGAHIAWIRANRSKTVHAEKENGKETGKWKMNYMIFLRKPLNDYQVEVAFFDITDGAPRLINSTEQQTTSRKERIIAADIELEKPKFQANRKYEMRVISKGRVVAKTTFMTKGEGPKYSGKVVFTDKER